MRFQNTLVAVLPGLVAGITPPNVPGMKMIFSEDFEGPAGASPGGAWNIMDAINTNNEVQTYTGSNINLQISGGGTIQFVPRKSPSGIWTSSRIESKDSWTAEPGKVMKVQASILLGGNDAGNKQGVWPAFWLVGDAMRHGTEWPQSGEIDIMEQVNGIPTAYGTVHCGTESGGPCNEPSGRPGTVSLPSEGFHTWSVTIDLTNPDWAAQSISWQLDGNTFSTIRGSDIGDAPVWSTLAHSPMYTILNVAVGGNWPGAPNDATLDGYGAMMEVQYVAVYTS